MMGCVCGLVSLNQVIRRVAPHEGLREPKVKKNYSGIWVLGGITLVLPILGGYRTVLRVWFV
jgi:hypothetical protein